MVGCQSRCVRDNDAHSYAIDQAYKEHANAVAVFILCEVLQL